MRHYLHRFFLLAVFTVLLVTQASALEYSYDPPEDYLFGRPTSQDAPYTAENPNVDRSKNNALIAPGFGTPTSYLPGSGEYLTPNLVPGALSGGLVNQVGSVNSPTGDTPPPRPPPIQTISAIRPARHRRRPLVLLRSHPISTIRKDIWERCIFPRLGSM